MLSINYKNLHFFSWVMKIKMFFKCYPNKNVLIYGANKAHDEKAQSNLHVWANPLTPEGD